MPTRVAACFHGFLRTGASMWWAARRLRRAGYSDVVLPTFGYHLRPLDAHAAEAAAVLRGLAERYPDAELDLVTHSYGGILARATLARDDAPAVRRVVMLSPPNQGAAAAALVRDFVPVHKLGWDPLGQILPGVPSHPAPPAEIGIVAGGLGTATGLNPLLGADNDGTVRVDETYLDGQKDHTVVPVHHSLLLLNPRTLDLVVEFLENGGFSP